MNTNTFRFDLNTCMPIVALAIRDESESVQNKIATLVSNEMLIRDNMAIAWKFALAHALMQDIVQPRLRAAFIGHGMTIPLAVMRQYPA